MKKNKIFNINARHVFNDIETGAVIPGGSSGNNSLILSFLVLLIMLAPGIACNSQETKQQNSDQQEIKMPEAKQPGKNQLDKGQMTDDQRLNDLLNNKLVQRVGNPEALDIKLEPQEEHDEKLIPDNDDREFLDKHRAKAIDIILPRFRENGSQSDALLLGYYNVPKALPYLKEWFIKSENFYGWESSFPDELNYMQFTHQHCYEEAIKYITSKPLEEAITLSEQELESLVQRYRKKEQGSDTALYVLYRLIPDVASKEFSAHFKSTPKADRFKPGLTMKGYFLKNGMSRDKVRELAGEPDNAKEQTWTYDCGPGWVDPDTRYALTITFENGKVAAFEFDRAQ